MLPKAEGLAEDFDRRMEQSEKNLLGLLTPAEQTTLLELLHRIDQNFDPLVPLRRPQNF